MRIFLCVLIFLSSTWASLAVGQEECPALAKLYRINKAVLAGRATTDVAAIAPIINAIADEVISIDSATLDNTFRHVLEPAQREILMGLIRVTDKILMQASSNDLAATARIIWSNDTAHAFAAAAPVLNSFECVKTENVRKPVAADDAKGDSNEPRNSRNDAQSRKTRLFFIAGFGITAIVVAAIGLSRMLLLRRRRARRYSLYYIVKWRKQGAIDDGHEGVISDISCYGAKLEFSPPLAQDEVGQVLLNNKWHDAKVQWSKDQNCGLKFAKSIRAIQVLAILNESRKVVKSSGAILA